MWIKISRGACLAAALAVLAACGGGSAATGNSGQSTNGGTTTQTIQGLATPSTVSVVTANNATN